MVESLVPQEIRQIFDNISAIHELVERGVSPEQARALQKLARAQATGAGVVGPVVDGAFLDAGNAAHNRLSGEWT